MEEITIRLFTCETKKGQELKTMIDECLKALGSKLGFQFVFHSRPADGLSIRKNSSAFELLKAACNNEIVIVDGSLERKECEKEGIEFGKNYECLTPAAMSMDNTILVSRTQIPLNFIPARSNVKPLGEVEDDTNPDNKNKKGYQLHYSNEQIIDWLMKELTKMAETQRLVRNPILKIDLTLPLDELMKKQSEVFDENAKYIKKEKEGKLCFISYRGSYHTRKKYNGQYGVEDVASIIKDYHDGNAEIKYFAEGVLSNELMPEVRRWSFVSYIDRVIRECDEFWIFNTRHKEGVESGYWDSWWCLGEILTILRMKKERQLKPDFKVMIFDPDEKEGKQIREADISKWHNITEEENRELARYYTNSDFLEAGFETVKKMRHMRYWPRPIRKLIFRIMSKYIYPQYLNVFLSKYEENAEEAEDVLNSFTLFEESVFSHVYDKSFMQNRIITCGNCMQTGNAESIVIDNSNFIWDFLNINGEYTKKRQLNSVPGAFVLTSKMFEEIMSDDKTVSDNIRRVGGTIKCNNNHLSVVYKTDDEFYVWWTPRMGRRTGPDKCIIETVPVYSSMEIH